MVDRRDVDLALAALDLAEPHDAVDLGDRRRILRTTRFEQLGDSRQTARDVARLVRFAADLGDDRSGEDALSIFHGELRARRDDEVAHALLLPALLLNDLDVRVELLFAVFDDDALAQTGELVELLGHRLVFDDVDEAHRAVDVGENRVRVRIPGEDHLVALHVRCRPRPSGSRRAAPAGARRCRRSCRSHDLMRISPSYDVTMRCLSGFVTTTSRSPYSIVPGDLRLARRLLGDTSRRSTDVERAQRELRARLADRLRGDDTDGFAQVDDVHRRQVAAVAHAAETALRLTGEDGADLDRLDARLFDLRAPSPRRSADRLRRAACGGPTRRARADPRRPRRRSCRRCAPTSGSMTSSPSFSADDLETLDRTAILFA